MSNNKAALLSFVLIQCSGMAFVILALTAFVFQITTAILVTLLVSVCVSPVLWSHCLSEASNHTQ